MHSLDAHWQSSQNQSFPLQSLSESSSIAPCSSAQCPPQSSQISVILSPELKQSSSSVHPCAYAQCPLGRAPTESSSDSVCNCVLIHSLASKVFSNLTGLPPELLTSVLCLSTSLSDSSEFRSASSCTGIQSPQHSVTPSWHETSKTSQPEITRTPAECITHNIHSQHIYGTHTDIHSTQNNAGKTVVLY
jgi:hypothetical protein